MLKKVNLLSLYTWIVLSQSLFVIFISGMYRIGYFMVCAMTSMESLWSVSTIPTSITEVSEMLRFEPKCIPSKFVAKQDLNRRKVFYALKVLVHSNNWFCCCCCCCCLFLFVCLFVFEEILHGLICLIRCRHN